MSLDSIDKNIKELLSEISGNIAVVAAAKMRTPEEVGQAILSGIDIIGENYIQDAEKCFPFIKEKAKWHFIGHLQKNKVKKAVKIFDMIETVDTEEIALEIEKRCDALEKQIQVLIEVNSGRESQKDGVMPEKVSDLINKICGLKHVNVMGLMTMGPFSGDPEDARPFFRETKKIYDKIGFDNIENVEMKYLSMGMTNSYKVAIEEGANMVRIGTKIFGERES